MDHIKQLLQQVAEQAGHTLTPALHREINAALARPAQQPAAKPVYQLQLRFDKRGWQDVSEAEYSIAHPLYQRRRVLYTGPQAAPATATDEQIVATLERHGVAIELGTAVPVSAQLGDLLDAVRELLGQPQQVEGSGEVAA